MRNFLIILTNILLVILAFFVVDYCAFRTIYNGKDINMKLTDKYFSQMRYFKLSKIYMNNKKLREAENVDSTKKPIVIFGCSFAWGYNLNKDETFSHRLAKLTGRPVYNRALNGMGPQLMLYQLSNDSFYSIVPKPEYVIYVYINAHLARMYLGKYNTFSRYLFYKEKKSKTGEKYLKRDYLKETLYRSSLINLLMSKKFYYRISDNPEPKEIEFFKLHLVQAKKEIEKHWGNDVKFVVLVYEEEYNIKKLKPIITDLEKIGIQFINLNDLSDINFRDSEYQISESDLHPNAKAWEVLTPLLVKKLGL